MTAIRILGISAFYHDSAAALVVDGRIVAAAQEERFTRTKHDPAFPQNAAAWCLHQGGLTLGQIDHVAFYDKPFLKFERLLETSLAFAPRGFGSFCAAMPVWLREKLFLKSLLVRHLRELSPDFSGEDRLLFSEHHLSHAASAFFPSPFGEAAVLTMDGVGEWATTSLALGRGHRLEIEREIHFPHSLGLLYSAFTHHTGFKVNSGEYKVMGLAPYGRPRYAQKILDHLVDVKADGSFRLNLKYFGYCTGLNMTNQHFDALFGGPARRPDSPLTQREMDLAASIQAVTEEIVLKLTASIAAETGMRNLCLAGGVSLNCVVNAKVQRASKFERLWIQPAAGDAGGAVGAALAIHHIHRQQARLVQDGAGDAMQGAFLGPAFSQAEIETCLTTLGARFEVLDDVALIDTCAAALAGQQVLGWFQGRMEFGPRALGGRSILADPRPASMQSTLNRKVKFRESFRPFAPSVLAEDAAEWFDLDGDSPYMLLTANVHERQRTPLTPVQSARTGIDQLNEVRSSIPAATHIDYSARVQTVHASTQPRFHALIRAFKSISGCPVLLNTSFNVRGEPMVATSEQAFRCFMGTDIDVLAIGNCLLRKVQQDQTRLHRYEKSFAPD